MRLVLAIVVLIVGISFPFVLALSAHAISYSNDTNSVDIDYTGPAPIGAPDSNLSGSGSGSGSGDGGGSDTESGGNVSGGGSGGDGVTLTVVVNQNGNSDSSSNGNSDSQQDAGSGSGVEGSLSGEDILNTLFGNQALSITGGSSGGDFVIRLDGKKVREALKARGISTISILNKFTSKFLTKKDYALNAVSTILENEQIEEIVMSLSTVRLSYRAQGRLFGVFPITYPISLTVNPLADSPQERVISKFPWYSFFVQKYVSKKILSRDINAALQTVAALDTDDTDRRARYVDAIVQVITSRVDTVEGSLR